MCKNAAEAWRKFKLFANCRKKSFSIQFVNIVILINQFEVKTIINFSKFFYVAIQIIGKYLLFINYLVSITYREVD